MATHNKTTKTSLKLCKVLASRERWRERSHANQTEKRKLSDRVRYLESRLQHKEKQLTEAQEALDTLKKSLKANQLS